MPRAALLVLVLLAALVGTARADVENEEAPPEPPAAPIWTPPPGWRVEPAARAVAATVIRNLDATTFYGFTCWRRRWSFFFNHVPPEGGRCDDQAACEVDLSRVTNRMLIGEGEGEGRAAEFEVFSNTYFKVGDLTTEEMRALLAAPAVTLRLDPKLADVWGRAAMTLPLDGLSDALDGERRRFDCPR